MISETTMAILSKISLWMIIKTVGVLLVIANIKSFPGAWHVCAQKPLYTPFAL
jgi:hypothetical protein